MPLLTTDQAGNLGELIAAADLSRPVKGRYQRPLFMPTILGGKYPTVDLIVDVLAADATRLGFFFVQIKSTESSSLRAVRLRISVPYKKYNELVILQAPTYIVGVDVNSSTSYLVGAYNKRSVRVSSISKSFRLSDDDVKINLYKEIIHYWKINTPAIKSRIFKDV